MKRALEEREAKIVENEKTAIFVRGQNTSERVREAMKDLVGSSRRRTDPQYAMKRPKALNFNKKNDIHPFEDASSLEFFSNKNDASLLLTGLHSKKRPHDLVISRMFDGRMLDQVELGIDGFTAMAAIDTPKASVGTRPLMVFHGDMFDTHPTFVHVKSVLLDMYQAHHEEGIPLMALEHVISVTCGPGGDETTLPKIHLRTYTVKLLSSGSRVPRVQLTEMGPSMDLSVRREAAADPEMMKAALKRPKVAKKDVESGLGKKRKNIETDDMGDKVGRIHIGKQDLSKLQSRKMKSLKVGRKARKLDGGEEDE